MKFPRAFGFALPPEGTRLSEFKYLCDSSQEKRSKNMGYRLAAVEERLPRHFAASRFLQL
jgi:hypothetical protein